MKVTISPSKLSGRVAAPASKSAAQRALAAALLHKGISRISGIGDSEDVKAALQVIQDLGATVTVEEEIVVVDSNGVLPGAKKMHCGESGLGLRMFTPIASLSSQSIVITGEGTLEERPMDAFDEVMPQLGVEWESKKGKLPFHVKGPLVPKNIQVDGSLSSQFITGLLLAYSGANASDVTIIVKDLKSRPYIDLTLQVMRSFGMKIPTHHNYEQFHFELAADTMVQAIPNVSFSVEGDWSGAAFLLVAGAIAGPVTITGLDIGSAQADRRMLDALMDAHAAVAIDAKGIIVHPGEMTAFNFDATDCPDLFPPLVVLALYCKGDSRISGVNRLLHKESNRASTLIEEFAKMGGVIQIEDDLMMVKGGTKLTGASVHSHGDHRIAMACAVAALGASGDTVISKAGAVRKSYPAFFSDLEKLGGNVSLKKKFRWHE